MNLKNSKSLLYETQKRGVYIYQKYTNILWLYMQKLNTFWYKMNLTIAYVT